MYKNVLDCNKEDKKFDLNDDRRREWGDTRYFEEKGNWEMGKLINRWHRRRTEYVGRIEEKRM